MNCFCICRAAILLIATLFLVGCWEIKYRDTTDSRQGMEVVGEEYEVVGKVTLYGYRDDPISPARSAFLRAGAGVAGPEIAFSKSVPIGTKILITGLQKTNDIPALTCRRALNVSLEGVEIPGDLPIHVNLVVKNKGRDCLTLNEEFYRKTKDVSKNRD